MNWYQIKEVGVEDLFGAAKQVISNGRENKQRFLRYLSFYNARQGEVIRGQSAGERKKIDENICQPLVDSAVSKIATKRVRPFFLTEGGTFEAKDKAEKLNQFSLGLHNMICSHKHNRKAWKDALIFGKGFIRVFLEDDMPKIERVLPFEIEVDERECESDPLPRNMWRIRNVSRSQLQGTFPDFAGDIQEAETIDLITDKPDDFIENVTLLECWHLPSTPDSEDGRYYRFVSNAILEEEVYTKDHFPFVEFSWLEPVVGYWGCGLIEEVEGLQDEITWLARKIQREMNLGGTKFIVPKGSSISPQKLNNEDGAILEVDGDYKVVNHNMVSPETFQRLEALSSKAFNLTGISQLSAQAQKPSGVTAGVALRTLYDIESERFHEAIQLYEEAVIKETEYLFDELQAVKELAVDVPFGVAGGQLNWKDLYTKKDKYRIQSYPASFVPATPAAKLELSNEMAKSGLFNQAEIFSLLFSDLPDVKSVFDRYNAPNKEVELAIYLMLVKGEPVIPEPFTNHQLAAQKTTAAILQAKIDGVEPEKIALLRDYLLAVKEYLDLAKAPPVPLPTGPNPELSGQAPQPEAPLPQLPPK